MALTELRHLSPESAEVLETLLQAAQAAEDCAETCIDAGDPEMARCIRLCRDVADLATLTARLMVRGSSAHPELAGVCADACETSADECARFDADHIAWCEQQLRAGAEACRGLSAGPPDQAHPPGTEANEDATPWS